MWISSGDGPNDPWKWDSRSIDDKMREHNARVQELWRARNERVRRATEQQTIQIAASTPVVIASHGNLFERLKQAGAILRMFHFSLQFGRLRIEITRASSKP